MIRAAAAWRLAPLLALAAACGRGESGSSAEVAAAPPARVDRLGAELAARSKDGLLLVNLWATWCPPCMAELPAFAAVARRHPELPFLGVSADWCVYAGEQPLEEDLARVGAAWQRLQMPFPTLYWGGDSLEALAEELDLPDGVLPKTLLYQNGRRIALRSAEMDEEQLEALLRPHLGG